MKIIVLGVGKVGATLTESLVKEGYEVIVIDYNEQVVTDVVNRYNVKGIVGGGLERETLIEAGISEANYFISCTSKDETNILCCVLAKKLGAKNTIARVRDPQYFDEMNSIRQELGIDFAFNPERRAAKDIAQILKFPSAKSVENFARGRANLVELEVLEGNPIIGKSLKELSSLFSFKILFGMIKRDEKYFIPNGDFVIELGDIVYIIAKESDIADFCKKLKIYKRTTKSAFIIGGGKIAYYLAKELISLGISVKILEKDKERCLQLSELLPNVMVLCGDGTDQSVLDEEGIADSDACITLTGIDEENVIISLYASQKQVNKVVTKIDRGSVANMVKILGIDSVISPKDSIANHILQFIRAHKAQTGSGVNTLYKLHDKVEALEFIVDENFKEKNIPIKNLKLKNGILIGGIVRGNQYILPSGDSELMPNDSVIIVTAVRQIDELADIFR